MSGCFYCKIDKAGRKECLLLTTLEDPNGVYVPPNDQDWCTKDCGPNNVTAQLIMLKRFGVILPPPPEGTDLLEWAKECVANGTAKMPPQAEAIQKQKAEQAKAMAELPSWFQQAKNLHKHAKQIAAHFAKTGRILVTPEQKAERLKLGCKECEKLRINPKTEKWWCGCCGCNVVGLVGDKIGKADFEALTCENWPTIKT